MPPVTVLAHFGHETFGQVRSSAFGSIDTAPDEPSFLYLPGWGAHRGALL